MAASDRLARFHTTAWLSPPAAIQRPSGLNTTCRTRRKVTSVARDGSIRYQRAVTQIALCRRTKPSQAQVAADKEAAK
jgi:hypothetical protein